MSKNEEKSIGMAYLSWFGCCLYICGLQRFYLGRTTEGWIYLFTLGIFGFGQFADLFLIPSMLNKKQQLQVKVEEAIRPNNNITQTVNINIGEEIKNALGNVQQPNQLLSNNDNPKQLQSSSTLDIKILKICKKMEFVSLTDCVIETESPIESVEASLSRLMKKGLVAIDNHSVSGEIIYRLNG